MTFEGTKEIVFAIPGDLNTPTGGYVYDRRVMQQLRDQGLSITHLPLGSTFPHPTADDTSEAASLLAAIDSGRVVLMDGLALGALEPEVLATVRAPIVALIHHPLACEGGLEDARRDELQRIEQVNLAQCVAVIVTSPATASLLVDNYDVPANRITFARPGTDPLTASHQPISPPLIVSVGSQSPRKGHDVLLRALSHIEHLPWQAVIAGSTRDEAYSIELHRLVNQGGLSSRVRLAGEVTAEQLQRLYSEASVFALATRFEGYGMVFDEAMTYGLPIVSCAVGAVGDTVAPGAGILVPADDPRAFADALQSVLADDTLREAMAAASHRAGRSLPTWSATADIIATVLHAAGSGRLKS